MQHKKLTVPSEIAYIISITTIAFAVAMSAAADFGVSMIVAPAYIMSRKFTFLTFGQWEYVLQGILFIIFCIIVRKVKIVYFSAFGTCLFYGAMLDLWRLIIPVLNPSVTAPGSMAFPVRVVFYILGMVLTSFSIALCFQIYLYPQVYDFFVKGVSTCKHIDLSKFKICFDFSFLALGTVLTLCLFGRFVGVGIGTLITTCCNGLLIKGISKIINRFFTFKPLLPKLAKEFEI